MYVEKRLQGLSCYLKDPTLPKDRSLIQKRDFSKKKKDNAYLSENLVAMQCSSQCQFARRE